MASTRFILNTSGWGTVCERAVLADGPWTRLRGLLGRRELPAGQGMLLHPTAAIHTAFMRFPIDVVFMDNDHRVLAVVEHLGAWRTAAHRKARFTLELAAGEVERRGIAAGDQLLILPQDPAHPEQQAAPRRARRARRAGDARAADAAASAAAAPAGGAGGAPQSMTVLVASADRRFRAVASSLLERRGWRVLVGEEPTQAAQLARLWSADVIVLDTDHSEAAPTQIAAQIGASAPEVGVVLVGEATESRVGQPLVQPKWGVFDELAAVIEDAYWRRGAHKLSA